MGGGEFQCRLYVVHVCLVVARGETHVRRFSHPLSSGATNWSGLRSCLHAQPISLSRHIDCTQPNRLDALLDVVLGISGLVGGTGEGLVRALLGRGGGLSGLEETTSVLGGDIGLAGKMTYQIVQLDGCDAAIHARDNLLGDGDGVDVVHVEAIT